MDAAAPTLLRLRVGAAWCAGLSALHAALAAALRRVVAARPRGAIASLSPAERGAATNIAVAAVHAVCMFVGAVAYLAHRVDVSAAGLLIVPVADAGMDATAAFWAALMLGYLVYDLGYAALFAAAALGRDVAAHHALGFAAWFALLWANMGGVYVMWVHLAEGSTPFLHACHLLYKLGADGVHARLYTLCSCLLLLTFFAFRVVAAPLCLASMWAHRALWGSDARALFYFALSVNVFFVALNWLWFAALLRRAARGKKKLRKAPTGMAPHGNIKRE